MQGVELALKVVFCLSDLLRKPRPNCLNLFVKDFPGFEIISAHLDSSGFPKMRKLILRILFISDFSLSSSLLVVLVQVILFVGFASVAQRLLRKPDQSLRKGREGNPIVLLIKSKSLSLVFRCVYCVSSSVVELIVLWRDQLWGVTLAILVKDLCGSFHTSLVRLACRELFSLLWLDVASSNKQLLQLQHIVMDGLILNQELVFVVSL